MEANAISQCANENPPHREGTGDFAVSANKPTTRHPEEEPQHIRTGFLRLRQGRIDWHCNSCHAIWAPDVDSLRAFLPVPEQVWRHDLDEGLVRFSDLEEDGGVVYFIPGPVPSHLRTAQAKYDYPAIRVFRACPESEVPLFSRRAVSSFHADMQPNEGEEGHAGLLTSTETVQLVDSMTAEESTAEAPNTPLDLRRERTIERPPTAYYEPGVIPVGRYLGLSGEAGAGKSLVVRDFCVHWSQGRSALDPSHRFDPAEVVIFDAENGTPWWAGGLDKMDAPLDLPNLRVICYPEFDGGLDTEWGARSFLRLVESLGEIDVLVIDTVSRFVAGSENDADTWHGFYRNAILPLRRAGIGVIRLDHLGKNAELGARGSSAKMSDLDAHYILTAKAKGSNDLTLKLDKRRQSDYDETVRILRSDEPLRHTRVPDGKLTFHKVDGAEVPEDAKVAALVKELDRLHISHTLTRRDQRHYYGKKSGTVKAGTEVWNSAMKFRRERAERSIEG